MTEMGGCVKDPPCVCRYASNAVVIYIGDLLRIRATGFERKKPIWAKPIRLGICIKRTYAILLFHGLMFLDIFVQFLGERRIAGPAI